MRLATEVDPAPPVETREQRLDRALRLVLLISYGFGRHSGDAISLSPRTRSQLFQALEKA